MMPLGSAPLVSVLLPTLNRPEQLRACVDSLLACPYPHFEIVVIDQSATPVSLPPDARLRVVSSRCPGKTRALNLALTLARGDIVAFTDDDCTVPPEWVSGIVTLLRENPRVGLVFAPLTAMPHDPTEVFVPTFLPDHADLVGNTAGARVRPGAGANMFARRALFDRIGGFDTQLGPGAPYKACEEFDLYYRTLQADFAVLRTTENPVVHWGGRLQRDGAGEQLLRDYWFGEGAVLAKHIRAGDWRAARLAARTFGEELKWAAMSGVQVRFKNMGRAYSWARGFLKGVCSPINLEDRLFRGPS